MFTTPEEASRALAEVLPRSLAKKISEMAIPALGIVDGAGHRNSRAGGDPTIDPSRGWPTRKASFDPKAIAARGGFNHSDRLARHLAADRALTFLMQVDLGEAAAMGSDLPSEGVLAFFYDLEAGPWDASTESGSVVWTVGVDQGDPSTGNGDTKTLSFGTRLFPPHPSALDFPKALASALRRDEDASDEYSDWLIDRPAGTRTKLLGSPDPEQTDPISSAVAVELFGEQSLTGVHWLRHKARINEASKEWRLLAQIALADVLPGRKHPGVVYFLIKRADLAARDFAKVFAVYQQG